MLSLIVKELKFYLRLIFSSVVEAIWLVSLWQAAASINSGERILFRFDKAAFSLKFLPFKVPYPVPFKLLGDEAKGWLDTTYLSSKGNIRISRGNKVRIYCFYRSFQQITVHCANCALIDSSQLGIINLGFKHALATSICAKLIVCWKIFLF